MARLRELGYQGVSAIDALKFGFAHVIEVRRTQNMPSSDCWTIELHSDDYTGYFEVVGGFSLLHVGFTDAEAAILFKLRHT